MAQTKAVTTQQKAVIKWKGEQITFGFNDVKTLICRYATDQEAAVFIKTCQSLQLNPFANEIYLIKYSEGDKAATVIDIHSYLKAAETNENFNGFVAGIVLKDSGGKLEFREGSLLLPDEAEKLVGGYARVFRKDREKPFYIAVSKAECIRYTKNGALTRFWTKEKQPMMLRKTGLKRALVEAFPSLFAGTLSTAEVSDDTIDAKYDEIPEGTLPPAFEKNGKPNWKLLYAKLRSELGVTPEQAHELIGAESFNDLLADGWTKDQIFEAVVTAQQRQKTTEKKPEQIIDVQTGEVITQEEEAGPADEVKTDEAWDEIQREAGAAAPAEAHKNEEPTGTAAPAKLKLKRDPGTITSRNELLSACFQDFKMQPQAVAKELGYKSQSEIAGNYADYYRTIASLKSQDG